MVFPTASLLLFLILLLPLAMVFGCRRTDASAEGSATAAEQPPADARAEPARMTPAETTQGGKPNRLAGETSLYLLMHAHNPVDWYPWCEEALAKAEREGKLIFLSIGYASCYWCHVMERESFMDAEVAVALNKDFVCIKVDREERPELDEIYMTALQVYYRLIGSPQGGGWPMTMLLTPDARPVMGGTYFPPRDTSGRTGLLSVLRIAQQAWHEKPEKLQENARLLAALVKQQLQHQPAGEKVPLTSTLVEGVLPALAKRFDSQFGGFGYSPTNPHRPKFPEPANLAFLLDCAREDPETDSGGRRAETMLIVTLEKMAAGGIRDHLGGGFHRYSTDRYWEIPHFEKMLYDNAQLASLYAEAHLLTGRPDFRRIAEETLDFVLREMTGAEGNFYSAIDAETDGEEGQFYVWRREELSEALDADQFRLLADVYGVGGEGNLEGRRVLQLPRPFAEAAQSHDTSEEQLHQRLIPIREKLWDVRNRRKRPLTDTKTLTSWNGLMIRGFADAGRLLAEPKYTQAAEKAAVFILDKLRTAEGRLMRTLGDGRSRRNAYLDDYAFLADGLIALHRATGGRRWLEEADRLTTEQIRLFADEQRGGFFFTSDDHQALLARSKDPTDSALPSGNAVSAANLVYLAGELDKPEYLDRARRTIETFAALLQQSPAAMPRMAVSAASLLRAEAQGAE
ncbi:MAG: thioredoxin domain-containing protein [Pirellulales bacterium]|nr:thioredoxin domain-containing protein [Pirellulales bacterium]